jgi:hypothetical protein
MNKKITAVVIALGISASALIAQDQPTGPGPGRGPRGPRPEGRGEPGGQRPPSPLIAVLDANQDGVIDANEIANASAALKTLDTNNDGQLTLDELRPARPEGPGAGPGPGHRGNRPQPPTN